MIPPGYRTRLFTDLTQWIDEGLITSEAAATIKGRYRADSNGMLIGLIFVTAILLGGGLIAFVASNWQVIPRPVRVAGLLSLDLILVAACAVTAIRRPAGSMATELLAALSVVAAGASISLVGQMYHFPANWPAFGFSMMIVALATALVARSSASIWLGAVAHGWYLGSGLSERILVGAQNPLKWTPDDGCFVVYGLVLSGLAASRWTTRSGPWTILVSLLPLLVWLAADPLSPFLMINAGPELFLAWALVLVVMAGERLPRVRGDAVLSALIGLLVLVFTVSGLVYGDGGVGSLFGRAVVASDAWAFTAGGLLAAVILAAAIHRDPARWDRSLLWLAVAIAAPFLVRLLGSFGRPAAPGQLYLILSWLLPLAALAVEARRSERSKTFAGCVIGLIALVAAQLSTARDLVGLSMILAASGAAALVGLMVVRKTSAGRAREIAS
jgi:uncharacterized membrane protein